MAGRNLGDAFVVIYPEAGNFLTELTAKVNAAIGAYKAPAVTVPVNADTGPALTAMTALIAKSKTLFESLGHLKADVQTAQGTAALSKMQAQVLALAKQMGALVLKADTAKFDAQIAAKIAQLRTLERQLSGLKMDADDKAFVAKLAALR